MLVRPPPEKIHPGFDRSIDRSRPVRDCRGCVERRKVKSMRPTIVVLIAMAIALIVFGGVAYAQEHQPPKTVLYKGERELQTGRLGSYC